MRILLDYNNDRVTIDNGNSKPAEFMKVKDIQTIREILEEILNRLDDSRLAAATPYFDVQLDKIDEDRYSAIGEW